MSFSLRAIAWMAFAVAVVLLVGSSILLYQATARQRVSDALVAHTHEVQTVLEDLSSQVFQASNSRQGFIISGNESLLAGYESAVKQIPQDIGHLRRLMNDNADRSHEIDAFESDVNEELALIASSLPGGMRGTSSSEHEVR